MIFNRYALVHSKATISEGLQRSNLETEVFGFFFKRSAENNLESIVDSIIGYGGENLFYTNISDIEDGKEVIIRNTVHLIRVVPLNKKIVFV